MSDWYCERVQPWAFMAAYIGPLGAPCSPCSSMVSRTIRPMRCVAAICWGVMFVPLKEKQHARPAGVGVLRGDGLPRQTDVLPAAGCDQAIGRRHRNRGFSE